MRFWLLVLWSGVVSADPFIVSDAVDPLAVSCGWRVGTAARVPVPVEVYGSGLKRCRFDLAGIAPVAPSTTKTVEVDATQITGADESPPSQPRKVKVTVLSKTVRYEVIKATTCTKAVPPVCTPPPETP